MQAGLLLAIILATCMMLPASGQVSEQQFRCMFPRVSAAKVSQWIPNLNAALQRFQINTVARVQMFLAQTGHETDSYNTFSEYTNSGGTNQFCPRYNGGCRYRGRGAIQLTHKYNYERAGKELGVNFVGNPDIVATPQYAFVVGGLFWKWNNLNQCSDSRDINTCTRKINGGTNGMTDRVNKYNAAKRCITSLGAGGGARPSSNPPPLPPVAVPGRNSCNVPGVGTGVCQNTATACSGTYHRGFCPGAANIRCCVSGSARAIEDASEYLEAMAVSEGAVIADAAVIGSQTSANPDAASGLSPAAAAVVAVAVVVAVVGIAIVIGYMVHSKRRQEEVAQKP